MSAALSKSSRAGGSSLILVKGIRFDLVPNYRKLTAKIADEAGSQDPLNKAKKVG